MEEEVMAEKKEDRINLNVKEYNRLRDFESAVKREDVVLIRGTGYNGGETEVYLSKDEAVIEIGEANKTLSKLNEAYKETNAAINKKYIALDSENSVLSHKLSSLENKILYNASEALSKAQQHHYDELVQKLKNMSLWGFIKWRRK